MNFYKNQTGASLYLKLHKAQGTFNEQETSFGLILNQIYFESIQDLHIEEIKRRGKKSIIEVLHYFLNSGIEIN